MSVALLQEVRTAISFKKQVDLVTALTATDMWSLRHTSRELLNATPVNENDKDDLGKGVYITRTYPSYLDAGGAFDGRLTSELAAQILNFWVGKRTKAAAGTGFKYTMVAPVFATDGLDLPAATAVVQIRTGGSAITDKKLVGICCDEFSLNFRTGPGRDNATMTSRWVGTGAFVKPSAITMPAPYTEHSLNAGGITALSLNGFDYIANKRFSEVTFSGRNNLAGRQSAHFPGSGTQSLYQLRGRMRRGVPDITLTAVVECDSGSSEEDNLLSQTEGTGLITCQGATIGAGPEKHEVKITFHRLITRASPIGESEGIAAYNVEYDILEHTTNGVFTIEITNEQDNILS